MRHIAGEQAVLMVQQVTQGLPFEPESFLWIRNIWQPDNIMANVIPTLSEISVNLSAVSGNDLLNTDIINVIRANYAPSSNSTTSGCPTAGPSCRSWPALPSTSPRG